MYIRPGEIHPDYSFDERIKGSVYEAIYDALDKKSGGVGMVITFPELSNYKMERELIRRYPGVRIYCFEKDSKKHYEILHSFKRPDGVSLFNMAAEDFLLGTDEKFDMIFFDYCGGPHGDLSELIRDHLTVGGVYAQTEFRGRGCKYPPIVDENLKPMMEPVFYGHMKFEIFRRGDEVVKVSLDAYAALNETLERVGKVRRVEPVRGSFDYRSLRGDTTGDVPSDYDEVMGLYKRYGKVLTMREVAVVEAVYGRTLSLGDVARGFNMTRGELVRWLGVAVSRLRMADRVPAMEGDSLRKFFDDTMVEVFKMCVHSPSFGVAAEVLNWGTDWKYSRVRIQGRWNILKDKIRAVMIFPAYSFLKNYYDCMVLSDAIREGRDVQEGNAICGGPACVYAG